MKEKAKTKKPPNPNFQKHNQNHRIIHINQHRDNKWFCFIYLPNVYDYV